MKYFQLIAVLAALAYRPAHAQCRRMARHNAAWNPLQNMLAPGNIRNMQPHMRNRRLPAETAMPVNGMNAPLPYRRPPQNCPCQLEKPCPRVIPEMRVPEVAVIPEIRMPEVPRMIEMPVAQQYVPNMPMGSVITAPAMFSAPEIINTPLAAIQNIPEVINIPFNIQERFECPCASPKALVNPFLPAASPVSAWAPPTSNMLPPATPNQARSHFLRKIPIPPPTL